MKEVDIALVGAGHMGGSLLTGLIANGFPPNRLWVSDPDEKKLQHLNSQFQINTSQNNLDVIQKASVIILAVKPQSMKEVATELTSSIQHSHPLIISIAAGIRVINLQKWLGEKTAIVRAMPNTPALIGCGATALYANSFVNHEQKEIAENILRSVSVITWLTNEAWLDIVTTLSGSGPAFYFLMIEAFQKAAEKMGLPIESARLLTLQTAYGASRMALESEKDVKTLRHQVTSPGGTTEKAIEVLNNHHFEDIIFKALEAGTERANEIGSTDPS